MIRRNIVQADRDQRVVKWALVAAVFALSVGCFAELTLARTTDEGAKIVAESALDVEPESPARIAG